MIDGMETGRLQEARLVRLATDEMASLWRAATGALLHGPRCSCVGFGMMHRSGAELERDIAEFLVARYEDLRKNHIAHFFQRWIDTRAPHTSGHNAMPARAAQSEGLLQWIDRNASSMSLSPDEVREIGTEIRSLLRSMATPADGFTCS